jgi:hypothetical protein
MRRVSFAPDKPVAPVQADDLPARIEKILQRQLDALAAGDLDLVDELSARAQQAIVKLGPISDWPDQATARRVGRIQNKLCLALAAQRQETADRLRKIRGGRRAVNAYSGGGERATPRI